MTGRQATTGPGAVALILVDLINDFYSPAGQSHYDQVQDTVDPITTLIAAARDGQRMIVHAVERHRPGIVDAEWRKLPVHDLAGSADGQIFPEFAPRTGEPREIILTKRRYSAFFATDLALLLHENGVHTVIIAGVKTNVCVRATATDAFAHGFSVVVPRESTNSNRPHLAAASLEDIERYIGTVCPASDAANMLTGPQPAHL